MNMGVPRLFQGRAKFSGGSKTYYLAQKHQIDIIFLEKGRKTYYFALPCGRP